MIDDSTEIKEVSTVRKNVEVPTPSKRSWRDKREERRKKRRERKIRNKFKKKSAKEIFHEQQTWVSRVIFFFLSAWIVFPFVVLFQSVFPVTKWILPAIVGLGATIGLFYLFRKIKFTIWTIIGVTLITLSITSAVGKYSFVDVAIDYRSILNNGWSFFQHPFPKYRQFIKATRVTPTVRQYSLKAATKNLSKQQKGAGWQYVQYFSVYKEIVSKWKYVNDPVNREYIAPAEESLATFCGDCDDYSVLMAACITSVGGTVRLVRTKTHVYPELKIESKEDYELVKSLIRKQLFTKVSKKKDIYCHVDSYGDIWINLDYTDHYPGAIFMSDEILSVLVIP